jgi:hypothetical protein
LAVVDVVEQFVAGKLPDRRLCEDAIVVTAAHAAVIDGATDITGRRYDGRAGGRWAMEACRDAVRAFPPDIDAAAAAAALTGELAARLDRTLPATDRPSASVTVFSATRRELWQIGDVGFAYPGLPAGSGTPRKRIDRIAADFRAAFLAAEMAGGNRPDRKTDPARPVIRQLIARQGALRNTTGPFGFAGIDGTPVPTELLVVHPVPPGVTDLVIATDGYPQIAPTLAETEAVLARLLEADPWCVNELSGTKGVLEGQLSFDDRAYLRLRI